jgi:L,D-transpeptidase ErfK/SrfK
MFLRILIGFKLLLSTCLAETYLLPPSPSDSVIGEEQIVYARYENTLLDIARRYGVGYDEIVKSNPKVNRWVPGSGTPILLPTRYILPEGERKGIVLSLSEMRLYYFPERRAGDPTVVVTFPVSVGRMDWKTPLGEAKIIRKDRNPDWHPPESIRKEHAAEGEILPKVIRGGTPDNPLGGFALRLSIPGYLLHGTDERKSYGIGMRVTHGCIRMYPEDIAELFDMVSVGTPVRLDDQPIKAGWRGATLYLEVHSPLEEDQIPLNVSLSDAWQVARKAAGSLVVLDPKRVDEITRRGSGRTEIIEVFN